MLARFSGIFRLIDAEERALALFVIAHSSYCSWFAWVLVSCCRLLRALRNLALCRLLDVLAPLHACTNYMQYLMVEGGHECVF